MIQGSSSTRELGSVVKDRKLSLDVKKDVRNNIIVPTVAYGHEAWKWNEADQSKVWANEMRYQRAAAGVTLLARVRKCT